MSKARPTKVRPGWRRVQQASQRQRIPGAAPQAPASADQWAASTGHIGLVFDMFRKLFALEKQSPLGAYLSAAELGRRVHMHGVRMCMCMACA